MGLMINMHGFEVYKTIFLDGEYVPTILDIFGDEVRSIEGEVLLENLNGSNQEVFTDYEDKLYEFLKDNGSDFMFCVEI